MWSHDERLLCITHISVDYLVELPLAAVRKCRNRSPKVGIVRENRKSLDGYGSDMRMIVLLAEIGSCKG